MKILLTVFITGVSIVQAGLFSSINTHFTSNPVILYSNGSEMAYNDLQITPQDYKSGVIPFDNLTQPADSGLEGILYDRGFSCQPQVNATITPPSVFTARKIALVKKGGNCTFYQKVYNSQLDGAQAVLIYDNIPFDDDPKSGQMWIQKQGLTITMYYIDMSIGLELYRMLQSTSSVPTLLKDNVTSQIAISIVMYPAIGGFPSAWEFTLIIIVALLAVSFLASVGMHWHLWRIRRRQRTRFESGLLEDPTFNRKVVDPQYLSYFPTRIIGQGGELSRVESNKSLRSNKALENAEFLSSNSNIPIDRLSVEESTEEGCVICLDEFSAGEKVRGLPCGHEYHCECIDPWLTIKSASCPLCKHDCTIHVDKSETQSCDQDDAATATREPLFSIPSRPPRSVNNHNSSSGSLTPERVEELNRSWISRSLPRVIRRHHHDSVIELPARMTAHEQDEEEDVVIAMQEMPSTSRHIRLPRFFKKK